MKTKLLALAFVGLFTINGAFAQEQGDFRLNAGMPMIFSPYGSDFRVGFGFGAEYLIADAFSVAPSYWLTNKDNAKVNLFNIDGRYYFMTDATQVYGVAGVSFVGGDVSSYTGFALGAGAIFGISDAIGINAELKYHLGKPSGANDPLGMGAYLGLVYTFGN
ncbi:outer membrane beta-barrel protein [Reichenbachiella sp.]|uniref:outer membrane beta-barrel protein n=1 Tax=Reichenbachiella sp. TaxID=2184521 RepID=UPI003B5A7224